jgi:outer membrane protein assembly factor BamE (lipoprotein component of BamABCDE complex)
MARPPPSVNIPALPLLLASAVLGGCAWLPPLPERPRDVFTTPTTMRGHAVTPDMLAQVTPGVSTRNDVQAALGSPSHAGTFSDESWYYISSSTRLRPARSLAVRDQKVVAVDFDARGTVREVRQIGEQDMRQVNVVSRETPSPGNERTLLQALFGNIGRFGPNPGGQGSQVGMTAPGAPNPGAQR